MRAIVWDGTLRLEEVPEPIPTGNEALLRVGLAGICNTDLEILQGYKGFSGVLGHEFVGTVVRCGDAAWLGKRVCAEINVGCGRCEICARGDQRHCARRTVLGILGRNGTFADYVAVPISNLHPLPDSLSDEQGVFVEPLAAAFEILEQITVHRSDRVAVLGDGKLGMLCAQVLALTGAEVAVGGRHPERRAVLKQRGIIADVDTSPAQQYDVVIEATGSVEGFESAVEMTRPRGVLVLKSTVARAKPLDLSPLVVKEITVVGSRCGPFDRAITALAHGDVDVLGLIAARYPLAEALQALQLAQNGHCLKVLLDVGEAPREGATALHSL